MATQVFELKERVALDPITKGVIGGAFITIAKEMAQVLYRMSYSSIIRESEDLGAGLFLPDGQEICESDSTPMHIGSLPW
ncbi:MAG TPA: hydantoinase B/oxoprolinase family protein, partial [Bacillota bacterium]